MVVVDLVTLFLVVVDPDLVEDRRELLPLAACFFALERGAAFFADAFFVAFLPLAVFFVELRAADFRVVFFVAFLVVFVAAFFVVVFAGLFADFLDVAFLAAFFVVFFAAFLAVLRVDVRAGAAFFAAAFFVDARRVPAAVFLVAEPVVDFLAVAFFVDLAAAFLTGWRPEDFLADFLAVERFVATLPSPSLAFGPGRISSTEGHENRLDPSSTPSGAARPIGRRIVEPSRVIRNDAAGRPRQAAP